MKNLCKSQVDPERETSKFGTHTLRKTGYLFAVWGNGIIGDIMNSARHKTVENAMRYYRDAGVLLQAAKDSGTSIIVGEFKSNYCHDRQLISAITTMGGGRIADLQIIASNMSEKLKIPTSRLNHVDTITKKILLYKPVTGVRKRLSELCKPGREAEFEELLESFVIAEMRKFNPFEKFSESTIEQIANSVRTVEEEEEVEEESVENAQIVVHPVANRRPEILITQPMPTVLRPVGGNSSSMMNTTNQQFSIANHLSNQPSQPESDKGRGGPNELPDRNQLIKVGDWAGKIRYLVETMKPAVDRVKNVEKELTGPPRTWYNQTYRPIMGCLQLHHGGNIESFLAKWPKGNVSSFRTCCRGNPEYNCVLAALEDIENET